MERLTQIILKDSELKIIKINTIEKKVTFAVSKSGYADFKGYTFIVPVSEEELQSSNAVFNVGRKKLAELAVKFFEKGYPYTGQTSQAW
jgi:hypothetical protein